jgi:NADH:ubiquinone oxidoreductase subunit K
MVSSRIVFNSLSIVSGFAFVIIFFFTFFEGDWFLYLMIGATVGPFLGGVACGFLLYRKDVKIIMISFPFLALGISILAIYLGGELTDIASHAFFIFALIPATAAIGTALGYLFNLHKFRERKIGAKQED